MKAWLRLALVTVGLGVAVHAAAQVTFYEHDDFVGRSFTVNQPVADFFNFGFNDRASSAMVRGGSWQLCSDANFGGRCVVLTPGDYRSLNAVGLNDQVSSVRQVGAPGGVGRGRIAFYGLPRFQGQGITVESDVVNFDDIHFNDAAQSAIIEEGTWQLCENAEYRGPCITLEPGRYQDLGGLTGRVSSARVVAGGAAGRPGPRPATVPAPPPHGRAVLFGQRGLQGRSFVIDRPVVRDLADSGFNDRASSLRVESGYWMFCSDADFEGECRTFGPGDYPVLPPELQNRISSGRRISNQYPYREAPNWRGY